ncbi:chemotaxis protein CheW [Caldichromatium japonicum]|uniref:chemotaxis protein CheW n=1 Tax=Caldichromatium japonicum TaxID=2699430 RepID=UPI001FE84407|nr:chemotaxis protein CheW [Caldichromatium japonicum]
MTLPHTEAHLGLNTEVGQYLTFVVAGERLAVPIEVVKEIIELPTITRVPLTPDAIRGVINLRGSVVPVIDLGARLGRSPIVPTRRSCIVLVEVQAVGEAQVLGMLVDEVKNILEIGRDDIKPPPSFGATIRTDFIAAMGRVDEAFVVILEVDHLLSIQELAALRALSGQEADPGIEDGTAGS